MNSLVTPPVSRQLACRALAVEGTIDRQVLDLLTLVYPPDRVERRRNQRYAYPHLIHLTPCTPEGHPKPDESVVVVGKDLSQCGLGFFHRDPIVERRVIASMQAGPTEWVAFLLDITWCRFNGHGWYDSGGRFLGIVPSPLNAQGLESPRD
jgi:hypothetical protein